MKKNRMWNWLVLALSGELAIYIIDSIVMVVKSAHSGMALKELFGVIAEAFKSHLISLYIVVPVTVIIFVIMWLRRRKGISQGADDDISSEANTEHSSDNPAGGVHS